MSRYLPIPIKLENSWSRSSWFLPTDDYEPDLALMFTSYFQVPTVTSHEDLFMWTHFRIGFLSAGLAHFLLSTRELEHQRDDTRPIGLSPRKMSVEEQGWCSRINNMPWDNE